MDFKALLAAGPVPFISPIDLKNADTFPVESSSFPTRNEPWEDITGDKFYLVLRNNCFAFDYSTRELNMLANYVY